MPVSRMRRSLYVLTVALAASLALSCGKPTIKIGFSGELSGARSDLGAQTRNGAQLAVEEINRAGGIANRQIELIVRDDRGTPEGAVAADSELVEAGVVAIVGHATSQQTLAAYHVTEKSGTILFSPSASTPELSGLKDHFFRILVTTEAEAYVTAKHIFEQRDISDMAILYDSGNTEYARPLISAIKEELPKYGGRLSAELALLPDNPADVTDRLAELKRLGPESIYIIASPSDAAFVAQRILLDGWQPPLFAAAWAFSDKVIKDGGRAVEGMRIIVVGLPGTPSPRQRQFSAQYKERFGIEPKLVDDNAFDAVSLLAVALEKTKGKATDLAHELLKIRGFEGVSGTINIDSHGEGIVKREWSVMAIEDGRFASVATLQEQ